MIQPRLSLGFGRRLLTTGIAIALTVPTVLLGPPVIAAESDAGRCSFSHTHHQEPVGTLWSQQVADGVVCDFVVQSVSVGAALEKSGVPLANDSESCVTQGYPQECVAASAQAPRNIPFCCVPSGQSMTNHGTWSVVLFSGQRWTRLPNYCSGVGTRTATCERRGSYTSGNVTDVVGVSTDDVDIATFEIDV